MTLSLRVGPSCARRLRSGRHRSRHRCPRRRPRLRRRLRLAPHLDGHVECDAIVMNGATLHAGAAATLQRIKNPFRVAARSSKIPAHDARRRGAERFAKEQGIKLCKPEELSAKPSGSLDEVARRTTRAEASPRPRTGNRRRRRIDRDGTYLPPLLPAARVQTSWPRRRFPSDRCGLLRRLRAGGVSCTGYGEAIMKVVLAKRPSIFYPARIVWTHRRIFWTSPAPIWPRAKPCIFSAKRTMHRGLSSSTATQPGFAFTPPAWPTLRRPRRQLRHRRLAGLFSLLV